ncbi:hypothetical protein J6590_020585 [Homalodisca vitripennis]|nr:hypothetical protein J6590_020585 [Homalodisca vitripennis]
MNDITFTCTKDGELKDLRIMTPTLVVDRPTVVEKGIPKMKCLHRPLVQTSRGNESHRLLHLLSVSSGAHFSKLLQKSYIFEFSSLFTDECLGIIASIISSSKEKLQVRVRDGRIRLRVGIAPLRPCRIAGEARP